VFEEIHLEQNEAFRNNGRFTKRELVKWKNKIKDCRLSGCECDVAKLLRCGLRIEVRI
jgi:hypothetical protein